jgi:hypothetical protein
LSRKELIEICKLLHIKCNKKKKDIIFKLLKPLKPTYKIWSCIKDDTCEEDKYSVIYYNKLKNERDHLKQKLLIRKDDSKQLKLLKIRKEICNIKTIRNLTNKYLNTLKKY